MELLAGDADFIDVLLVCCCAWVVVAVAVALATAYLHDNKTRSVRVWTLMAGVNMLAMTAIALVVKEIRAAEAQQMGAAAAVTTTTPLGITGLLTSSVTTIASLVSPGEAVPINSAVLEVVGGAASAACFLVGLLALWGRDVFLPSFWPCWLVCLAIAGLGMQDQCEGSTDAVAINLCSYHKAAALMVVPTLFFSFAAWERNRKRKVD